MPTINFKGGSVMPAFGTPEYQALQAAQSSIKTDANASYNPGTKQTTLTPVTISSESVPGYIKTNMEKLASYGTSSSGSTSLGPSTSSVALAKSKGGVTPEEAKSLGLDLSTYKLDNMSGYYLPRDLNEERNAVADRYESEINQIYGDLERSIRNQNDATVASIRKLYGERVNELKEANKRALQRTNTVNVMTGTDRYAGSVAGGILAAEERAGIDRLNKLGVEEERLVAEANSAMENKLYALADKKVARLDKIKEERVEVLTKQIELAQKQNEEIRKRNIESTRDSAIAGLIDQGITNPSQILDYLNFDDNGNMVGDFTSEEVAKSLKNLLPENKTQGDLGIDGRMYELAKKSGWISSKASIFDYWKMEAAAKKSPSADKVGMGTADPADYNQFSRENVALSVIPAQLKNSEVELKRLLTGIRMGLGEGRTPYEVADNLMGYRVENPSAFSEGMRKFVSIADLDSTQIGELGRLINGRQYDKAISLVENRVYEKIRQQQGDRFVSEPDVIYVKNKADEITDLLGKGWANEVGAFTGTFGSWLSKKFGFGEAVRIKAKITNLAAELANKRGGSAITEEEWDRLIGPNIPSMNDNANTFKQKLQELVDDPLSRLNSERTAFSLPELDTKSLTNRSLRIPSYSSEIALDPAGLNEVQGNSGPKPEDPAGLF